MQEIFSILWNSPYLSISRTVLRLFKKIINWSNLCPCYSDKYHGNKNAITNIERADKDRCQTLTQFKLGYKNVEPNALNGMTDCIMCVGGN